MVVGGIYCLLLVCCLVCLGLVVLPRRLVCVVICVGVFEYVFWFVCMFIISEFDLRDAVCLLISCILLMFWFVRVDCLVALLCLLVWMVCLVV